MILVIFFPVINKIYLNNMLVTLVIKDVIVHTITPLQSPLESVPDICIIFKRIDLIWIQDKI